MSWFTKGDFISVLLDTSYLLAFYSLDDDNNNSATELAKEITEGTFGTSSISDYIFDEAITLLKKHVGHKRANEIGDYFLNSSSFYRVDQQVFAASWSLSKKFERLSFTDCSNIALMKHYNIDYLATFDSGFDGIIKVLR
ncbi:type II toxin-antitoxin system VapC family toxin [Candidatus Micrarchaeota archaeon]|nr:type II toxin-antitoxin system VapC family toxin [Candidatus Micrarchaeota archaeon]